MNDDDVGEVLELGSGSVAQLTEMDGWTHEDIQEHQKRLARKKPLGFAPWPPESPQNDA